MAALLSRTENDSWKQRERKTRIYTQGGAIDEIVYPNAQDDPCTLGECESYQCRSAHATWLLEALMGRPWITDPQGTWGTHRIPEANHASWKAATRSGVARERQQLLPVLEAYGYRPEAIRYARTAGCSCGCSPAWIAQGDGMRGYDLYVDLRSDAQRASDSERWEAAREERALREAYAQSVREEDAMA